MKALGRLFMWSWLITLPLCLTGGYIAYNAYDRFTVFQLRYKPDPAAVHLATAVQYEIETLQQAIRVGSQALASKSPSFKRIDLFVPKSNLAELDEHMPQSGFEYVSGRLLIDQRLVKAKIKYRGDYGYHWIWDKKSIRVKTDKNHLYQGIRAFNLLAPKFSEQLNNYLAYQLAEALGLVTPHSELVELRINNENQGIRVLVEQFKEETLRRHNLMPADVYRGEILGKDAFLDGGIRTLFDSATVWDKVAVNNHYDEAAMAPLSALIDVVQQQDEATAQSRLSELLDIEAWAKFSVFEALAQTRHYDTSHNWRLYYDPWRQKFIPVVWDPVGWPKGWRPKGDQEPAAYVIETRLHQALFKNGDFLRARAAALAEFFTTDGDQRFLEVVNDTVNAMNQRIVHDKLLRPADPEQVSAAMEELQSSIERTFAGLRRQAQPDINLVTYTTSEDKLQLLVAGYQPVQRLRVEFPQRQPFTAIPRASLNYTRGAVEETIEVSNAVTASKTNLVFQLGLLPDLYVNALGSGAFKNSLGSLPARYTLDLEGIVFDPSAVLSVDLGSGWQRIARQDQLHIHRQDDSVSDEQTRAAGMSGWQIFWDTGAGFRAQDATPIMAAKNQPEKDRIALAAEIPRNSRKLRIDLPPNRSVELGELQLEVNGQRSAIPLSAVVGNQVTIDNDVLRTDPTNDPYFYFDVSELTQVTPLKQRIEVSFSARFSSPWENSIRQGTLGTITALHSPTQSTALEQAIVWSGEVNIEGVRVIEQPLVLMPGTILSMSEGANLIVKRRLLAEGTAAEPIVVRGKDEANTPWGAIVLLGQLANGSRLGHCEFAGGSGLKDDLYEYTAMLSIHHVSDVEISDCHFRDSQITDDMVHAVYSEVSFNRSTFYGAPFDALDVDISKVLVSNSLFEGNGNDAIDLMTSTAGIFGSTIRGSADKGISVGERSNLLAVDNQILDNAIGVQAKDQSVAVLLNQTLAGNDQALHAYKKNWRYEEGGMIIASKSKLSDNKGRLDAGKRSQITLFDSYLDATNLSPNAKRVTLSLVDNQAPTKAVSSDSFPTGTEGAMAISKSLPEKVFAQSQLDTRGALTDAR